MKCWRHFCRCFCSYNILFNAIVQRRLRAVHYSNSEQNLHIYIANQKRWRNGNKTIKNNTSFAIDPPKLLIRQRKYQKGEKSTFDFFSKAIGLGEKFSLVNKLTDCNSKKQRRICQRYIVQQFFGFGTFLASECITYQPSTYTWFETTQDLCGQTLATKRSHLSPGGVNKMHGVESSESRQVLSMSNGVRSGIQRIGGYPIWRYISQTHQIKSKYS